MIPRLISKQVLIIGTHLDGKGGIAILLKSYSQIFPVFYYVCSHKFSNRWYQLWITFTAFFKVVYYCSMRRIKIVHIHTASYRSFFRDSVYLLIAKLFNKKIIMHIHGGEFEQFFYKYPHYCRCVCQKADCVVAVSYFFGKIFRRLQLNHQVEVLYNAAEKPLYQKIYDRDGIINILFLGTIDDNKGVFDVLKCFMEHKDYFQSRVVLHIGGIGDSSRLEKEIKEFGLQDVVLYHGWMNQIEKNHMLAMTDIYIQPSYFESLGIAIIESMSYGIPVIASNTGGIPELVDSGSNGFLIPPGDMEQFFCVLSSLIENNDLCMQMGMKSLEKSRNFTIEQMEINIVELYRSFLNN